MGAKVITCSDSNGYVYDPDGIDLALLKDIKEVRRARISEYVKKRKKAKYFEDKDGSKGVWTVKADIALPCATQNELDLNSAKILVKNGVKAVGEGANMPSTLDAIEYLQKHKVLFAPAKASNVGGVSVSALEMSQNSERLHWTFEEVDERLKGIMHGSYTQAKEAAERYGVKGNLLAGANLAGFEKVATAMQAQGWV
jgi:glutamate dehydrogenase (NADP+)